MSPAIRAELPFSRESHRCLCLTPDPLSRHFCVVERETRQTRVIVLGPQAQRRPGAEAPGDPKTKKRVMTVEPRTPCCVQISGRVRYSLSASQRNAWGISCRGGPGPGARSSTGPLNQLHPDLVQTAPVGAVGNPVSARCPGWRVVVRGALGQASRRRTIRRNEVYSGGAAPSRGECDPLAVGRPGRRVVCEAQSAVGQARPDTAIKRDDEDVLREGK